MYINITRGVLQGESVSPLLFSLFLNDFDDYMRAQNLTGLNIDGHNDILSIMYADDIVLLSSTHREVCIVQGIN